MRFILLSISIYSIFCIFYQAPITHAQSLSFIYQSPNPLGTQGHALGDMNGDGFLDIILAEYEFTPICAWLEYPGWDQHNITNCEASADLDYISDLQADDIDGDGDTDIVIPSAHNNQAQKVILLLNNGNGTSFTNILIWTDPNSSYRFIKDTEVADIDGDGRLDIALRYGGNRNEAVILYQDNAAANNWVIKRQSLTSGSEGMGLGDITGDSLPDFIYNGRYLVNPGNRTSNWSDLSFGGYNPSESRIAVGDIDGDGVADPVISNSESYSRVVWFKKNTATWTENSVTDSLYAAHTLQVADIDGDGNNDIVSGTLKSDSPGTVVFINSNNGTQWVQSSLLNASNQTVSSYIGKVGDIDANGTPDIMTSDSYDSGPIHVWLNVTPPPILPLNLWTYINIDSARSDQPFGMTFTDINNDGYVDVLTGKNYYLNPGGDMAGIWAKTVVPESTDFKLALDVDSDSYADVIGNGPDNRVRWYEANSQGTLDMRRDIGNMEVSQHAQGGQGYVVADIVPGGKPEFILNGGPVSPNNSDIHSLFYFTVPTNPLVDTWAKILVSSNVTGDGLDAATIDSDSDVDITTGLGTDGRTAAWWTNNSWAQSTVGQTNSQWIDTVKARDFDLDGDTDIVIANEGGSSQVYVFTNSGTGASFTKSSIYNAGSENIASLDAGDVDLDGDIDIVIGEHQGTHDVIILKNQNPNQAWEAINLGPAPNGGDHHLGTRLIDLDNDGDLDIVSHGYNSRQFVHLWRNDALTVPGTNPSPTATPFIPSLDNDTDIDFLDLLLLQSRFGLTGLGDINNNGLVDIFDFNTIIRSLFK